LILCFNIESVHRSIEVSISHIERIFQAIQAVSINGPILPLKRGVTPQKIIITKQPSYSKIIIAYFQKL